MLHYVLGSQAYTTAWAPAVSDELDNAIGELLRKRGDELAPPRAGRGAAAGSTPPASSARSRINGVSGLCITKLDVLDGMEEVKLCTGYGWPGLSSNCCRPAPRKRRFVTGLRNPSGLERQPPWACAEYDKLPARARTYLDAPAIGLRRADRNDLHRSGQERDHRQAHPFHLISGKGPLQPQRQKGPCRR